MRPAWSLLALALPCGGPPPRGGARVPAAGPRPSIVVVVVVAV